MISTDSHISIDFWSTLVNGATGGDKRKRIRYEALQSLARKKHLHLTDEDIERAQGRVSKEFDRVWMGEQRTYTTYELVVMLLRHLDMRISDEELDQLIETFEHSFLEGAPELAPYVEVAIPKLAERYSLSIISDTMFTPGHTIREYLRRQGLFQYFHTFIFSDEAGYSKPDPRVFKAVLEATHTKADQSYHIGDLQQTDIQGAQSVGMNAILYTGITKDQQANTTAEHICASWEEIVQLML